MKRKLEILDCVYSRGMKMEAEHSPSPKGEGCECNELGRGDPGANQFHRSMSRLAGNTLVATMAVIVILALLMVAFMKGSNMFGKGVWT